MVIRPQSEDETKQKTHHQSIEHLSEFLDMPRERIAVVYQQELIIMGRAARIDDYLPILVSRRVKKLLRS